MSPKVISEIATRRVRYPPGCTMPDLPFGLFDLVLNQFLEQELARLDPGKVHAELEPLDPGDSHAALADYLREVLRAVLPVPAEADRLRQPRRQRRIERLIKDANFREA